MGTSEKSVSVKAHPVRHALRQAALDLIFPRSCVGCGDAVGAGTLDFLCAACHRSLIFATPPACQVCGYPFFGALAGPQTCPHCVELDPLFGQGKTLFLAKGPGRSLLHELKYRQGFYVLDDLAVLVRSAPFFAAYLRDATLVPVPLHPDKERERGFNQSERIARMLVEAVGGSTSVATLLQRVRFTKTQTRLNRSERHENMKNAFALVPGSVLNEPLRLMLVDDVFTTGSTLNACARVLREAGAASVNVATIGHG